jgi:hypothetical protein
MQRNDFLKSENLVYAIFLLIAFSGIIYFKGFNTAFFLLLFILVFAVTAYSIVGIYNLLWGIKEKWLVWQIILSILLGAILYYQYGTFALLKAVSVSVVIAIVIGLYSIIFNRKR